MKRYLKLNRPWAMAFRPSTCGATLLALAGLSLAAGPGLCRAQSSPDSIASSLPTTLTIDEAVDEAVRNNLGLLAAKTNFTLAEAAAITAGLKPNPVFSFGADHLDALGYGFNSNNGGGPSEIGLRVDVPIERAHKRELRLETAQYDKKIAAFNFTDAVRKLQRDVSLACIEVIQARENLELIQQGLKTLEELVRINDERVKAGSIAPLELTRSQVAMLQFRTSVMKAELELATARTKLQNLLSRPAQSGTLNVAGELTAPLSAQAFEPGPLHDTAFELRPDVQALQTTQARSQSELKLQVAQGKVDFTYGAEYRRQQGVNGKGNSVGVFFSAPLPVYNRNQGDIARVQAEQEQLLRQMKALQADVASEVTTALQEFNSSRDLVASIEKNLLKPAEQARDTAAYVYRSGGSTLVEFLDAQRAFNETMQSYRDAQAAYRRAVVNLNAAVNKKVIQ